MTNKHYIDDQIDPEHSLFDKTDKVELSDHKLTFNVLLDKNDGDAVAKLLFAVGEFERKLAELSEPVENVQSVKNLTIHRGAIKLHGE